HPLANPWNGPPTMNFIGPTPYLVGLSCREARRVMEASYVQFDSLKGGPSASHWVNMDRTVVFLGGPSDIMPLLLAFSADEAARFKHLALNWSSYVVPWVCPECLFLRSFYPGVESLIVRVSVDVVVHYTRHLLLANTRSARLRNDIFCPGYWDPWWVCLSYLPLRMYVLYE
ncbi:hypothetical protein B0I37DRAFT_380169, partial [Chaetomium sp. MPI-CAGE-AT-0009]